MTESSLDILPVELIHRILVNLDVVTIFRSFRHVCKRFYTIVNTYDRYELDLRAMSKNDFHCICQIIHSKSVISLTLSDSDTTPHQIRLFLSLFNINKFVQLRSLTLIDIKPDAVQKLMKNIKINSLQTLSINIRGNGLTSTNNISTAPFLPTSILTRLHRLDLIAWKNGINNFIWPEQCFLKHLTIGRYIKCKEIFTILSQLTHLQTLVVQNGILNDIDEITNILPNTNSNTSLASLSFINSQLKINELEILLSLTPNLVHLHLISNDNSCDNILDGSRWENFIQTKLIFLKTFEFFFRSQINLKQNSCEVESWIIPFRTSFWLEHKSWFVTCDFLPRTETLRLYTIPICDKLITYESNFDKMTFTTCPYIDNSNRKMSRVRELELDLTLLTSILMKQTMELPYNYLFTNLTELILVLNVEWSLNSIEYLSALIDLSKLNTLAFHIEFDNVSVTNTINNISNLLRRTNNVRSLTLANSSQTNC